MPNTLGQTDMGTALTLFVVGISVVTTTLVVLALVIGTLGRALKPRAAPAPVIAPPRAPGIDPRHRVVISAAVAAAIRSEHRIHRIVLVGREAGRSWVTEGRVTIMGSHHLSGRSGGGTR